MAVTTYGRLRMLWGAFDLTLAQGQTPQYGPTQIVSGGTSAAAGSGIGVRRVTLVVDRTAVRGGSDVAVMHFDFLNMTSGAPDDTWIASDYTNLETALTTWWTALGAYLPTGYKMTTFIWHRVGTGVSKPNPAERTNLLVTPLTGTGGTSALPPQVACSITFRTAVRKSWGRTYFPIFTSPTATGALVSSQVDAIAGATNTLVTSAATQDMHLVVVSKPLASSLNVEHVEVDDVLDVIRRRRWKTTGYRKILP